MQKWKSDKMPKESPEAAPGAVENNLAIRPEHRQIIRAVLPEWQPPQGGKGRACKATIYVFGSRARGTVKKAADLDLAIDAGRKLTLQEAAELREKFEESDLPYKVDLVDLYAVSEAFAKIIRNHNILFF